MATPRVFDALVRLCVVLRRLDCCQARADGGLGADGCCGECMITRWLAEGEIG